MCNRGEGEGGCFGVHRILANHACQGHLSRPNNSLTSKIERESKLFDSGFIFTFNIMF